jgi:hypothetical protein
MVMELGLLGKQIRYTLKVLKCSVVEGCKSVGLIF